jgi:hypothetical protein
MIERTRKDFMQDKKKPLSEALNKVMSTSKMSRTKYLEILAKNLNILITKCSELKFNPINQNETAGETQA